MHSHPVIPITNSSTYVTGTGFGTYGIGIPAALYIPALPDDIDSFDPNLLNPIQYWWATFVPNRRPRWKLHRRRGDAKNSAWGADDVVICAWGGSQWVEKYRHKGFWTEHNFPVVEPCVECGVQTGGGATKAYIWHPMSEFKLVVVCPECKRKLR